MCVAAVGNCSFSSQVSPSLLCTALLGRISATSKIGYPFVAVPSEVTGNQNTALGKLRQRWLWVEWSCSFTFTPIVL